MHNKQSGSFHVVLLAGIGIALVGAVGYLFYQNVLVKDKVENVSQNSESQKEPVKPKKEYCAPKEKLCFKYPDDWSIKQIDSTTSNADNFTVTSPDGQLAIQFLSGIGGIGGCCGPMAEGPVTVVGANKVDDLLLGTNEYLKDRADSAYVSTVVTSDVEAEFADPSDPSSARKDSINGYIPQVLLHNANKLVTPSTFTEVQGGLAYNNLMAGKNASMDESDPANIGSFLFGTVTLDLDSKQKIYNTLDEAKKELSSKNFTTAKEILLSAQYK